MQRLLGCVMIANAALFVFGAVQHAGIALGPFYEPIIIPAAVVETTCALSLGWGAAAVLRKSTAGWRTALLANCIALAGVLLGILALAAGRGPRTASNDLYHRIMLVLIGVSLAILIGWRSRMSRGSK
jgi:hypothetical protein